MEVPDLDNALRVLVNSDSLTYEDPAVLLKDANPFSLKEKYLAFEKLFKDGYCDRRYEVRLEKKLKNKPLYMINYDGQSFYKNGGYRGKNKRDRLSFMIARIEVFVVVLAGITAALYYTKELVKFSHNYYSTHAGCHVFLIFFRWIIGVLG